MLNIILFGPPGAGKGTQSQKLVEHYQLEHISTGDLLRSEMAAGTALGKQAQDYMQKGALVPDAVVIGMIESKLKAQTHAKGIIFDGFPRTLAQAQALDELLQAHGQKIACLLSLEVEEGELTKRILERGKTSGRIDDQNEELVKRRVQVYRNETEIVATHYEKQGKLERINGIGEIEEITQKLKTAIDKAAAKS
ncbi:adenylate kinase [Hugenholtzia roseola]|uniref:adenylate kinase n=1 Tax=Hugenholtzia roseola TaxID=1002 RepID=UPI0003F6812C|nr:adenylate kinase [Hugenholtzia roseola]